MQLFLQIIGLAHCDGHIGVVCGDPFQIMGNLDHNGGLDALAFCFNGGVALALGRDGDRGAGLSNAADACVGGTPFHEVGAGSCGIRRQKLYAQLLGQGLAVLGDV